jgi:hypothetical protein
VKGLGGQRGAALVEAVVAIPFFVILFASVIFIGQSYGEKLRVMRDAKQRVWSYAMANCGEGDGAKADGTGIAKGAESNGDNGGADTSEASHAPRPPERDVIKKDLGSAAITVEGSVTASGILGGARANQKAYRKVMCNEPPYDGDLLGTAKAAYHDMTGW